jgi:acyl-CoA synthetase (AMP-forming)/AMP-acid ligase II/acyl carrier protein
MPDCVAYKFLADGEIEESQVTYYQQDCRARAIAAAMTERRAAGERALLLYPRTLDFISAFLGCLYSGVIAVPLYPPRSDRSLPRLAAVTADAQAKLILTTSTSLSRIRAWVSRMPDGGGIEVIATDQISPDQANQWARPDINPESLAFLQYTSGSTSAPKGVMVTHGNLLHNEEMISKAFSQSESSRIVSWLPVYHDMGLIGGVLQPLYLGATCILMSPFAFVQKPIRWLQAISKYRATTSGGPNFAYELCATFISQEAKEGLDLSSWKVAYNGAEPVREDTLRRFSQAFATCGFREEAFYPCYGLAEATLFVTGGNVGSRPRIHAVNQQELGRGRAIASNEKDGKKFVGCGRACSGQQVAIVDPERRTLCAEGEIGEIWVSGPSVTQGYWNRPKENSEYFSVLLNQAGGADNRLFMRTGDLGFLHQQELFITGRIKDVIIIRGRNYYPQDLELTAERTYQRLIPGCSAAFFIESSGEERVVLVQEVESSAPVADLQGVMERIRSAISQEYELTLHEVVLIKARTIPKTSSGKIQRQACKAKYLKAELEVIARNRPAEDRKPKDQWWLNEAWESCERVAERAQPAGRWAVVAEAGAWADAVAEALQVRGADVERLASDVDMGSLAARLEAGGGRWRGVLHLAGGGLEPDVPQQVQQVCMRALTLVQALGRMTWRDAPRLWLVTRGVQPVGGERAVALAEAGLWGLGRVIALEYPEWRCTRVDVARRGLKEEAAALVDEVLGDWPEEEIALRTDARLVNHLVTKPPPARLGVERPADQVQAYRLEIDEPRVLERLAVRETLLRPTGPGEVEVAIKTAAVIGAADATYVIAGGLGGLGLVLARWLVERGARHLVLVGRRGAEQTVQSEAVAQLTLAGTLVEIARGDIADRTFVARLFDDLQARRQIVRGIVHAAGVLDDALLEQQDGARFARVLEPKVAGAWNLHELSARWPLDFFVLFSSAAALIGLPGQGSYSAANAFLDALARHRQTIGLPGLSIGWGAFSDVGMAAAGGFLERLAAQGIGSLTPAQGIDVLDRLIGSGVAHIGVAPFDMRQWTDVHPEAARSARLARLATPSRQSASEARERRRAFLAAAADARVAMMESLIRGHLARALRLPAERIDSDTPFRSLGLDSLMSLEVRNRLEAELGVALPATLIWRDPTLSALAQRLVHIVIGDETGDRPQCQEPATRDRSAELEVERMSDEVAQRELELELTALVGEGEAV